MLPFFPRVPGMCWRVLDCSLLFSFSDASIMETVCWQQISLHISFPVKLPGLRDKQFSCEAGGGRGQHSCKMSDCSRGWRSLLDFSKRNCREWMLLSTAEKCWRSGIHQTSFSIDTSRLLIVQIVLSNPVNYELMKNSSAKKSLYNFSSLWHGDQFFSSLCDAGSKAENANSKLQTVF